MTSVAVASTNYSQQHKMPLSRTHPFSVSSLSTSGLSSNSNTFIRETSSLTLLKSVFKEQSPPCSTASVVGGVSVVTAPVPVAPQQTTLPLPLPLPEVSQMQSTPCSASHPHQMCMSHQSNPIGCQMKSCSSSLASPSAGSATGNGTSTGTNGTSTATEKPKAMVATPEQVIKLYMNKLTRYEHIEILRYPEVYFIGANAKKRPGVIGRPNNCDYDNDQGSYIHIPHDHVAYRYEVLKIIGKGSFGQVVRAYDHKTHQHVALKMVRNEKRFHRQAQEEIRILEHLRKQDKDNTMNIIHMYDSFTFRNHMCITFELLSINLHELTKKNKFQGFSLQLVRKFSHSLLQCLDALHKNKIIHCDMKPENVLLKQQGRSGLKVRLFFCL